MTVENIIQQAQQAINSIVTPEVLERMTDEQKKQLNEAKSSLTLGSTFDEKIEQLKKLNDMIK